MNQSLLRECGKVKTELTRDAERFLWNQYISGEKGVFECYEVSVGGRDVWSSGEHERVDFMSYDMVGDF